MSNTYFEGVGAIVEALEQRRYLDVVPPTDPAAYVLARQIDQQTNLARVFFTDNNDTETGYRVEWSEDGSDWPPQNFFPAPVLFGDIYQGEQILDAGQDRFYRVRGPRKA